MSTVIAKKEREGDWMFPVGRVAAIFWQKEDAETLRKIREDRNLSLRELVDKVNQGGHKCTYGYVHKLETLQTHRTNPLLVIALAQALEVSVYDIVPPCLFLHPSIK